MKKVLKIVIPILIIIISIIVVVLLKNRNTNDIEDDIKQEQNAISSEEFNKQFDGYGGRNTEISRLKELFNIIEKSNSQHIEHQIEIDETGITNVDELQEGKTYFIQLYSNQEKYINKIKITEEFSIILNPSE